MDHFTYSGEETRKITSAQHDKKLSKTSPTNKHIQHKYHLPNKMPMLFTKILSSNKQNIP
jgi:hypothetical protein